MAAILALIRTASTSFRNFLSKAISTSTSPKLFKFSDKVLPYKRTREIHIRCSLLSLNKATRFNNSVKISSTSARSIDGFSLSTTSWVASPVNVHAASGYNGFGSNIR